MSFHSFQAFAAIGCVLLSACGGSDSGSSSAQPSGFSDSQASLCSTGARAQAGAYVVENNAWNRGAITRFTQCVGIGAAQDGSGAADAEWHWSWPGPVETVRAYPEVIFGQKPWFDTTTDQLPRVVDHLNTVRAGFSYTSIHDGTGNFAFDIWLTGSNVKSGDHLPLKHELMIWIDTFGMTPMGPKVDTVTIDGITWDLHATQATWVSTEPPYPQYLAYVPRATLPSPVSIDVRKFLNHLKQRGSITGQEWLASVELGNEVMTGSGHTRIGGYKVTLD